jgi:hypothetical protein
MMFLKIEYNFEWIKVDVLEIENLKLRGKIIFISLISSYLIKQIEEYTLNEENWLVLKTCLESESVCRKLALRVFFEGVVNSSEENNKFYNRIFHLLIF